jgi:SAM-dependent methyltransferase
METLEAVEQESQDRLYPSLTSPSWLVLRKRREIFRQWLAGLEAGELDVLDVGGRTQPYRPFLKGRLRRYVAIDLRHTPLVDIVACGEQIPLATEQFDLVICTQVLQYVAEPAVVIAELHRVLKPGGHLILSVPAIFPRESDEDRWRFQPRSLKDLLHVFDGVQVVAEGSSISGFFRTVCICITMLVRPQILSQLLQFTFIPVLNLTAKSLEFVLAASNDEFAANFSAIARK